MKDKIVDDANLIALWTTDPLDLTLMYNIDTIASLELNNALKVNIVLDDSECCSLCDGYQGGRCLRNYCH